MHRSRSTVTAALALVGVAGLAGVSQAQVTFSGTSADAAGLAPVLNAYRADLGALNPNQPGTFGTGRREINWDAVPDAFSAPNAFPAAFFNGAAPGRARGVTFSAPGGGFAVSADNDNPTGTPTDFADIDPSYAANFEAFTAQRLFTSTGNRVYDVNFFIPGTPVPAASRGFGAVFSDVDLNNQTSIEYFDIFGASLVKLDVPAGGVSDAGFSFLGASWTDAVVGSVRITLGTHALGPGVLEHFDGLDVVDLVVADDFVYGEPVPTPGASGLLALAGLAAARRRRA